MNIATVPPIVVFFLSALVQPTLGNSFCGVISPCDSVNCVRYVEAKTKDQPGYLKMRIEEIGNVTEVILDCDHLKKTIRIGDSATKEFPQTECKIHYDSISKSLKNVLPGRYVETCCDPKDSSEVAKDFHRIKIGLNGKIYETGFRCERSGDVDTSKYQESYAIFKDIQDYVVKHLLKEPRKN